MSQKAKTVLDLDDTNYDNSEFVFSWNTDSPILRPDLYKCPKCNNNLKRNCKNGDCGECGYPVSVYGYRDLEYDNEIPYPVDGGSMNNNVERETKSNRRVRFENTEDQTETRVLEAEDLIEGMDNTNTNNNSMYGAGAGGCCSCICMVMIVLCIAYSRGDLVHKNGTLNFSLILCIIFFPYFYLSYVIVDVLTAPGR
jgi:hypothetical protein